MKILSCSAQNFGSYKHLDFSFDNLGLALVSGDTGSGKSTLMDLTSWCLFGTSSKNGASDDVRQWGREDPTEVTLELELPDGNINVGRIRGKPAQNDTWWTEASDPDNCRRGKDALDTQRLLEERIGMDADTFAITAYFSQFSDSDRFFIMKPRERREILEKICDLTLPISLGEKSAEAKKVTKKELDALESTLTKLTGTQEQLERQKTQGEQASVKWETDHEKEIKYAEDKSQKFETETAAACTVLVERLELYASQVQSEEGFTESLADIRQARGRIDECKSLHRKLQFEVSDLNARLAVAERDKAKFEKLTGKCPTCLGDAENINKSTHIKECTNAIKDLTKELNNKTKELDQLGLIPSEEKALTRKYDEVKEAHAKNKELVTKIEFIDKEIEILSNSPNVYQDRLVQLRKNKNPYSLQILETKKRIDDSSKQCETLQKDINTKTERVTALSCLYDLSFTLRGELLRNSVKNLEKGCNRILEKYFDGEFRTSYALDDDKLQVTISRNGYDVPFRSLSGGQRRMLTLSLFLALRELAMNKAGVDLNLLILDEALNGLDSGLKVKAFRIFEELSEHTESIILIDHDEELKSQFSKRFEVSLVNDESVINDVTAS